MFSSLSLLSGPDGERYALAIMRSAMHRKVIELMRLEIERLRRMAASLTGLLALASAHDV